MQQNNTYQFYGLEDIKRYLSGSMNAQEMHDMEKAALSDPLLADAIDGFKIADAAVTDKHLNDIRAAILGMQEKEHLVVPITKNRNNWLRWMAAACSLGLIAGSIWWFTQKDLQGTGEPPVALVDQPTEQTIASEMKKSAPVSDTLAADIKMADGQIATAAIEQNQRTLPQQQKKATASPLAENTAPVFTDSIVTDAPLIAANTKVQNLKNESFTLGRNAAYAPPRNEINEALGIQSSQRIYGKVTDQRGVPIKSATIAFEPNKGTVSNADGIFAMPAGDTSVKAAVSMVGFKQTMATLTPGKTNNIVLAKEDQNMDEVVVVGYGKQQKRKGELGDFRKFKAKTEAVKDEIIYPEEGWTDFYQELSSDLGVDKSKATKTLQIKFTVDDNGDPVDFTIVESPDEVLTKKAIEFIKKSKWKNFKLDKNALVKIEVN